MNLVPPKKPADVQIIGIHVGGPATHKTSLVRARCYVHNLKFSGISEDLSSALLTRLGPVLASPQNRGSHEENSPLFWEAFCTELGPVAQNDPDSHLLQKIDDLGGAQIFCLDAPISLPSCSTCKISCPGVQSCPEKAVRSMLALWKEELKSEERSRMPFPHTERFFETYARRRYEHPGLSDQLVVEPALSSNRAPLTARAHHLARQLRFKFPNSVVIETHPWLAAAGWALHSAYQINHIQTLRQPDTGKISRAGLLKKLEIQRYAMRSAHFIEDLFLELSDNVEIFAASIAALSAWGLLNDLCDVRPEFIEQGQDDPLTGWAMVPRELATYGWGH
ncbi:MAG: hypothetical protein RJB13_1327 [Pseudomonadota bacterium]